MNTALVPVQFVHAGNTYEDSFTIMDSSVFDNWTASPDYLIYNAGTFLVSYEGSARTPYTKTNDGLAVFVVCTNFIGWTGPMPISTSKEATYFDCGSTQVYINEFDYLGLHWYLNRHYWNHRQWSGGTLIPQTSYHVIDCTNMGNDLIAVAKLALDMANVQVISS